MSFSAGRRAALGIVSGVVLLCVLVLHWPKADLGAFRADGELPASHPSATTREPGDLSAGPPIAVLEREPASASNQTTATNSGRHPAVSEPARVIGRAVLAASGSPPAGATVAVRVVTKAVARHAPGSRHLQETAQPANWDGRFELTFDPREGESYVITVRGDRVSKRIVFRTEVRPGETLDLGTVALSAGELVRGRVVLPPGESIEASYVCVMIAGLCIDGHAGDLERWSEEIDDEGSFVIGPLPAGTHEIDLLSRDWLVTAPVQVGVHPGTTPPFLELRPKARLKATGTVRDVRGRPVANAAVVPILDRVPPTDAWPAETSTDAGGRFRMVPRADGEPVSSFRVRVVADGFPVAAPNEPIRWGEDVAITLEDGGTVRVRAVDAVVGSPVPGASVAVVRHQIGASGGGSAISRAEDGTLLVHGVGADVRCLRVSAPGYLPATTPPFVSQHGGTSNRADTNSVITVELQRSCGLEVHVVDGAGNGLRDCVLELIGDAPGVQLWGQLPSAAHWEGEGPFGMGMIVSRATTDPEGRCRFRDLPPGAAWLRCGGAGAAPFVHGPFQLKAAAPNQVEVVARPGVRVVGRLVPTNAAELVRGVRLRQVGGPQLLPIPSEQGSSYPLDGGRFVIPSISPGSWQVVLEIQEDDHGSWGTGRLIRRIEDFACGVLTAAGAASEFEVDASALEPGMVGGRLIRGAAGCTGVACIRRVDVPEKAGRWARAATLDAAGCFAIGPVRPGQYQVYWRVCLGGKTLSGCAPGPVTVLPGARVFQAWDLDTEVLTIQLRDGENRPVRAHPVCLLTDGIQDESTRPEVSNQDGQIVFPVVTPARWVGQTPSGRVLFRLDASDLSVQQPIPILVR